jgi:hypothetical protein
MALSQDEQRVLAEIERRLAADDPGLASCLTTFRRPGPATVLRSPRARIIGSLFTVLLVAMISLMVYAMIPFRAHMLRHNNTPTSTTSTLASISDATSPPPAQQPSAGGSNGAKSTASQSALNRSAKGTPAGKGKPQAKAKPTTTMAFSPESYP